MKTWLKGLAIGGGVLLLISVVYVAIRDAGVIRVGYAESESADHEAIRQALAEWRGFEVAAAELDSIYMLPRDLTIWFADCGQSNAFYNREHSQVIICYELVADLIHGYAPFAATDSALAAVVWQTTFFVFYHEIGHALIDILDLPTTGREEDAVDQLATLVLLNGGDVGRDATLQGAAWFWLNARSGGRHTTFWDEHSLDQQRYYNILCWVYGSNQEQHHALLRRDWGLPADRAQRCLAEHDRMSRAWARVLEEHMY